MLKILEQRQDLATTQDLFAKVIRDMPAERVRTLIKFRGGPHEDWVLWLPELRIWAHFGFPPSQKANKDRFWNVFGVGRPRSAVRIVCEINSPFEGIDRKIGGAFAESDRGARFILHRGNFRGGGLSKEVFLGRYRGTKVEVIDGDRRSTLVQVLQLGSKSAASDLASFIHQVGRMKGLS